MANTAEKSVVNY